MDPTTPHHEDVTNFSPPSTRAPHSTSHSVQDLTATDRMPTVSAAQALQNLQSPMAEGIAFGLRGLDDLLQNRHALEAQSTASCGGAIRGKVTEIYGPPGVGKTALR